MKFFTSITVVTFSVIIMVIKDVFAARGCPYGWVPYAESCYLGLDGSMKGDWATAVMQCDQNNATMMVPSSDWENEFIFTSFPHDQTYGIWINCNDVGREGEWKCYEDGNIPTNYRKWEPDQPDDEKIYGAQDFGFMIIRDYKNNPDILGFWGDTGADEHDLFIVCEQPRQDRCGQFTRNV